VIVVEPLCAYEFDVNHGVLGHWNYSVEKVRQPLAEQIGSSGTVLDAWSHVGQWGIRCAKMGASEVVLLEESLGFAKLCKDNITRNNVDLQCTALHRSSVIEELKNMVSSGIRFNCVSLNIRVKFDRYYKQRHGQYGRWFKPSLKGYETAIRFGAEVTSRGGYLVVTFLLPLSAEHLAWNLIQGALERASRTGSIIAHTTCLDHDTPLASSTMDDAWNHVVMCVRLS